MADMLPSSTVVCRDLWAMHLDTLKDPPPPEPLNEANMDKSDNEASDDEDESSKPKSSPRLRSRTEDRGDSEEFDEEDSDSKDESNHVSRAQKPKKPKEDAYPGMKSILEEMSAEDEEDSDNEDSNGELPLPGADEHSKKSVGKRPVDETPMATVCVLILACWTMRVSVIYMDFVR